MIVIDPGHGGSDPGGGSNEYWKEKDLALKISNYQFRRFKELGIPVSMTRYTDETLPPNERTTRANELTNFNPETILISNHINNNFGRNDGAEVIYSIEESDELPRLIGQEFIKKGQNIRNIYQRTTPSGADYYFIIRNTRPSESIIVEYGFADSPGDDIEQLLYNWEALAEGVVQAVLQYKEIIPKDDSFYVVTQNDTLFTIANQFNTTVQNLIDLNNLNSTEVIVGQLLKIK